MTSSLHESPDERRAAGSSLDPHRDNVELALAVRELARVAGVLQQVESQFRLLIEGLEDGVLILDATGRIEAFNASALHEAKSAGRGRVVIQG